MKSVVDCLEERGLVEAITSETLRERALRPLRCYIGFDPSADSLHLGNLVGIVIFKWFQKFGHTPVIVLGGATGRIGDPSGKSVERPLLSENTIDQNVQKIKKNFEQVLDFSTPGTMPLVLNNNDWLGQFALIDFLRDVGKYFRIGPMLAKDSIRSRLESEEGISFTEFSYLLLQAYDFYHLFNQQDVILQMGGSDQWGNLTAGMDLIRKLTGQESYGLTWPLLTRSDGKKFGKSEEGAIWLSPDKCSPYQFYQYLMRIADADVIKLMRMLTFVELAEIRDIEADMKKQGYIPNTAQRRLSEELTRLVHGEEGLRSALRVTEAAAPGTKAVLDANTLKEIAREMPNVILSDNEVVGHRYVDVVVKAALCISKGEATRLIQNGGAYLNEEKVSDPAFKISISDLVGGRFLLVGSGKKKKILIEVRKPLA